MEDYIKCELISGGSPKHVSTLSSVFIVAVHYTHQHMLSICIVATVDCPHVHHVGCP